MNKQKYCKYVDSYIVEAVTLFLMLRSYFTPHVNSLCELK